jgi:putative ABC transport system substrate-binding protein
MKRREFIGLLSAALIIRPQEGAAQSSAKTYRLASLTGNVSLSANTPNAKALLNAMARRGYTLGKNLAYDARGASGELARIPQLIEDFKASGVDVLVTVGYPAARSAKAAGIPTVIAYGSGDPVATGLVNSLAQPGGMVTGISDDAASLSTKRLSLLTSLSPNIRKVAMLWNKNDLGMSLRYEASAKAAGEIGVAVQALGVQEPDDFNDAFTEMDRDPPDVERRAAIRSSATNCALYDGCSASRSPSHLTCSPRNADRPSDRRLRAWSSAQVQRRSLVSRFTRIC